jgi:hypothetical protein
MRVRMLTTTPNWEPGQEGDAERIGETNLWNVSFDGERSFFAPREAFEEVVDE